MTTPGVEVLNADAPIIPALPEIMPPLVNFQGQRADMLNGTGGVSITPSNNASPSFSVGVAAVAIGNVTIATLQNGSVVDGVALSTGELVLLPYQTSPTQNGVYLVPVSGPASLAPAYANAANNQDGRYTFTATGGTVNNGTSWLQRTPDPLVIGVSVLLFTKFHGQIENQQDILSAVKPSFSKIAVIPNFQKPNMRIDGGIQTFDNSDLAGFLQFPDAQAATTYPLANLTSVPVLQDGVTLVAGQTLLVKNGIVADAYTAVAYSTTSALPAYVQAGAGVGATLTASVNGALPNQDGVAPQAADRILVAFENGENAAYNGIYTVTSAGGSGSKWVLTRATDNNAANDFVVDKAIPVTGGTLYGGTVFVFSEPVATVDTSLVFVQPKSATGDEADLANGLYTIGTVTGGNAPLTRRTDFNETTGINFGSMVFVESGTANGKLTFYVKTANPIAVDTTPILFAHLSDIIGTTTTTPTDMSGFEATGQYSYL